LLTILFLQNWHRPVHSSCTVQWQARADSTSGTAFWLALEDERALGLIGMWVDAVKSRAQEQGHGRVFLDVAPDNHRAANFYLRQGFVFIDECPHWPVTRRFWSRP
jgi:GNAT superfamily N-acetyltransferase